MIGWAPIDLDEVRIGVQFVLCDWHIIRIIIAKATSVLDWSRHIFSTTVENSYNVAVRYLTQGMRVEFKPVQTLALIIFQDNDIVLIFEHDTVACKVYND